LRRTAAHNIQAGGTLGVTHAETNSQGTLAMRPIMVASVTFPTLASLPSAGVSVAKTTNAADFTRRTALRAVSGPTALTVHKVRLMTSLAARSIMHHTSVVQKSDPASMNALKLFQTDPVRSGVKLGVQCMAVHTARSRLALTSFCSTQSLSLAQLSTPKLAVKARLLAWPWVKRRALRGTSSLQRSFEPASCPHGCQRRAR